MKRVLLIIGVLSTMLCTAANASDVGKVGSDHKGGIYGANGLKWITHKHDRKLVPFNTGEMVLARQVERLAVSFQVRSGDSGRPGMVFVVAKQDMGDGIAYYSGSDHNWRSTAEGGGSGRAGQIAPTKFYNSIPSFDQIDISKGSLSRCGTGLYTVYVGYGVLSEENEERVRKQATMVTKDLTMEHLAAAYMRDDMERNEKYAKVLKIDCT